MRNHYGRHLRSGVAAALTLCILGAARAQAPANPIPVETLFRKPAYGGATLSPNGRYLAVLVPIKDRRGIAILDLDKNAVSSLSPAEGDAIDVIWQNNDRMIVRLGELDRASGEYSRISGTMVLDRDGSNGRRMPGSIVRIIPGSDDIIITGISNNRYSLDLIRWNSRTGHREVMSFDSPGDVSHWIVDFQGVPRAAISVDVKNDKSSWFVRKDANAPWQKVAEGVVNDLPSTPLQFSPDGRILYVASQRGADRSALYEYSVASGSWSAPVISHPGRDIVGRFVNSYEDAKILGFVYADERPTPVWFDKDWASVQKSVDAALPDTANYLQHGGDRWIVTARSDRNPGDVYLLERSTMKMQKLFAYRPWIDPAKMSPSKWVKYPARDGLVIPALFTVPFGKGDKPVPLVVDIHGGPYVYPASGLFDTEVEFFASRGYAVLRPQFRGTLGFGTKFRTAGYRKWGDEMQDDLEDGVKWAVAQGVVDPERVCFFGESYGGYAAIWEAIRNPSLIKCAVSLAGPTSIDYLFDNAQTDLSYLAEKSSELAKEIGDPATERARFKRVSPLDHADKVGVPLLLAYGLSDVRVPFVHGSDFKSALDKYGKTYEWATYSNEAHGLSLDENVFDFYNRVDHFLAKYLQPAGAVPN